MKNTRFLPLLIGIVLLTLACGINPGNLKTIVGSGVLSSQKRSVNQFSAIEVAGSADVSVNFGKDQSVIVEAEDNILPQIETSVMGNKLVIGIKPLTSISPKQPIRVTVTVRSLDAASVSGSGNITINSMNARTVRFDIPGSGNVTAAGTAESVTVTLGGSGNISCDDLKAKSASVKINGSGNVKVYASESLDATIDGSGTVQYRGNPANIKQSVPGSGSIISVH